MKRITLISSLFITLFFMGFGNFVAAQTTSDYYEYYDDIYGYVANSDARIITTIREVGDEVHLEAQCTGYLSLGIFAVSLSYDPEVVVPIMGPGGIDITVNLTNPTVMGSYLWINPDLPFSSLWRSYASGNVTVSGPQTTTYVTLGGVTLSSSVNVAEGDVVPVFKLFFRKLSGQTLSETTFTYYNSTVPPVLQQNQFFQGVYIRQQGNDRPPYNNRLSEMFTRRSPSTIETLGAHVRGIDVTLAALANAEGLPKQTNPLQLLDWDNIETFGFIYSKNDVFFTLDEYSRQLQLDGVLYDFPYGTNGTFTMGGYAFNMVSATNFGGATRIEMEEALMGLDPEEVYYAYSFMTYRFQTTDEYPILGERIMFITGKDCSVTVPALVADADTEICEGNDITLSWLESLIEQESGYAYPIYTDKECTEAFAANLPTDYSEAAYHTFYVLAEEVATGCVTYPEDALEITIAVNPVPELISTSETELYLRELEEFYLFVEVEGEVSYQWYFNGAHIEGATQFCYSDIFTSTKAGTYSVSIENECATFHVEFQVHKALGIVPSGTEKDYKLTVYPNPIQQDSKLLIFMELPEEEMPEATAHILDMNGKRVKEYHLTQFLTEIQLNAAEGTYMVRVNTKSGKELITKIIVQ